MGATEGEAHGLGKPPPVSQAPGPAEAETTGNGFGGKPTPKGGSATERPTKPKKKGVSVQLNIQLSDTPRPIPIEEIVGEPDREEDQKSFEELVRNLEAVRAVLVPLIVRQDSEHKKYRVIAGRRRFAAALEARLKAQKAAQAKGEPEPDLFATIPCREILGPPDPVVDLAVSMMENHFRKEELPIEKAKKLREVRQLTGLSCESLGEITGLKSKGTVHELLTATEMPEDWIHRCEKEVDEDGNVTKKAENLYQVVREYKEWVKAQSEAAEQGKKPPAYEKWKQGRSKQAPRQGAGGKSGGKNGTPVVSGTPGKVIKTDKKTGLVLAKTKDKSPDPAKAIAVLMGWIAEYQQAEAREGPTTQQAD
jgi:hypothetical protein